MALPINVEIVEEGNPAGTITVRWDGDPLRTFNYWLPIEWAQGPNRWFDREEFLDWLVANHYESLEEMEARKQLVDVQGQPKLFTEGEKLNLTPRGEAYRVARELDGVGQGGPRPV